MMRVNGHPAETVSDRLTRAVVISLFTWRRAEPDDDTETPMGWWGDTWPTVANDRIGSRLYLLRRSRLTAQTAQKARDYIAQALQWMREDGIVDRMDIAVTRSGLDTLTATLTLTVRQSPPTTLTFDNIWEAIHAT